MKKIIYLYLLTINLQDIILRIIYGDITGGFHPGIVIKGFVLFALFVYCFGELSKGIAKNVFTYSILFFFILYFFQIIFVEIAQFDFEFLAQSFSFTIKIFLYLLIAYYVFKNSEYFIEKLDNILLFNVIVVLINIIGGYYFKVGGQSYEALEDSYRGFLAGNDTSIFSFVSFGYGLYIYKKNRFLSLLIVLSSVFAMYIIATKAFFVAGIVLFLYLVFDRKMKLKYIFPFFLILLIVATFAQTNDSVVFLDRLFVNYNSSLEQADVMLATVSYGDSFILKTLNNIAPGRMVYGVFMLITLFTDNIINILLGYGVGGIYNAFGRPPMMDILMIMGVYGVFGFFTIYIPLFTMIGKLIRHKDFDLVGGLFFTIFLYGALGGFLLGYAGTSSIFALLFGIMMSRYYRSTIKKAIYETGTGRY
ncbi:MAG: hypothetical protein V4511_04940 [Bacteroidota bacterium]